MEERKYELTNESINYGCCTIYRIKALRDFGDVKKGDLGGYIEKENNLSHRDNCWIYNNAMVFGNAQIFGNAAVKDEAQVYDNALVYDNAIVCDDASIGYSRIYGNARVCNRSVVVGCALNTDADISSANDYLVINGIDEYIRYTSFYKAKNGIIRVNFGMERNYTLDEFIEDLNNGDSIIIDSHKDEYKVALELVKLHFNIKGE